MIAALSKRNNCNLLESKLKAVNVCVRGGKLTLPDKSNAESPKTKRGVIYRELGLLRAHWLGVDANEEVILL